MAGNLRMIWLKAFGNRDKVMNTDVRSVYSENKLLSFLKALTDSMQVAAFVLFYL